MILVKRPIENGETSVADVPHVKHRPPMINLWSIARQCFTNLGSAFGQNFPYVFEQPRGHIISEKIYCKTVKNIIPNYVFKRAPIVNENNIFQNRSYLNRKTNFDFVETPN